MLSSNTRQLSPQYAEAVAWALTWHDHQVRHNTCTPYISHLLETSALVLEEGADETSAIAGLLHDVVEDHNVTASAIAERFGQKVATIVEDCTDASLEERKAISWKERKMRHLKRMRAMHDDSLLVIAADKVSSLRSLNDDLVRFGGAVFNKDERNPKELLWQYSATLGILTERLGDRAIVLRLTKLVDELDHRLREDQQ